VEVVASLSQGRTAAAQCGLFTYKSVPVIFEPPCISSLQASHSGYSLKFKFRYLQVFERILYTSRKQQIGGSENKKSANYLIFIVYKLHPIRQPQHLWVLKDFLHKIFTNLSLRQGNISSSPIRINSGNLVPKNEKCFLKLKLLCHP